MTFSVNGSEIYFEVHGSGEPVMLFHGFLGSSMYADNLSEEQLRSLRELHPGGDLQVRSLMASTRSFAESHDDMDFTPPMLAAIRARME